LEEAPLDEGGSRVVVVVVVVVVGGVAMAPTRRRLSSSRRLSPWRGFWRNFYWGIATSIDEIGRLLKC
jgi:hypothetical protein